jgi:two-component system cell cycle sensor histidine kinase/response regulator CckA
MERDSVLDCAFDAIVTMDGAGAIVSMNTAAERMLGYSREEAEGRELAALIIPVELREEHRRAVERDFSGAPTRIVGQRLELEAVRADRTRFPIELSVSRIDSPGGLFYIAWIRDISERRRTEEALRLSEAKLRQAQKMEAVGRLAGGVAHDFNNVLTAIFGYVDLVLEGLAFSRKQVMLPQRINLNEIIRNLETLLLKLIGQEIVLHLETSPSLWDVTADPGQIEQVLMNLASNARDAMPEGGHLTISTANEDLELDDASALVGIEAGRFVRLTVADTGQGIPDHVRAHIFEPFFTTKDQGKGTGLGLATVYGIVKQSGGWVYLDETPGPGASFRIYLPRIEGESRT